MADRLSLRRLNRASLHRQGLVDRFDDGVPEVVGRLAGLQAQHANSPYVALWSRRSAQVIADLESALLDRSVVKATLMRATLHLVAVDDYPHYDVVFGSWSAWEPTARKAGLDLDEMNRVVRDFCSEPRSVAEIEEHLATVYPPEEYLGHVPGGVRNPAFRMGMARGGLVHVPPSGLWQSHDKPRYLDRRAWLGDTPDPDLGTALAMLVERYLLAYGPASADDILKWAGLRRVTQVRETLASMGDRVVSFEGPDGAVLFDLGGQPLPEEDVEVPVRFLSRWDSLLISYSNRDRVLPPRHKPAVIKKNGDFLPTFLVDGFVAGLWSVDGSGDQAALRLAPFNTLARHSMEALETEGGALLAYLEPEASAGEVVWV